MKSFKREYAEIYDVLYGEKDYHYEIKLIEDLINEYKPGTKKILDYGCGTGNHAKVLTSKGYETYGIDKNEHMLNIARQKLKDNQNIHFYRFHERTLIHPDSIDLCIALFDVFSYMNTNEEINDFLSFIKEVLVSDGLFIFDFWFGPGVINLRPEQRWKEYHLNEKRYLRLTRPTHNSENCNVHITHEVIVFEKDRVMNRFTDTHSMRYFFKNEIQLFLHYQHFKILKFGTWNDLNTSPTINDWSSLVVSRLDK